MRLWEATRLAEAPKKIAGVTNLTPAILAAYAIAYNPSWRKNRKVFSAPAKQAGNRYTKGLGDTLYRLNGGVKLPAFDF